MERELEKVLHRFVMYGHQSEERLDELLRSVCELRGQLVTFGKAMPAPRCSLEVVSTPVIRYLAGAWYKMKE